jgi:pimeloyl-ACP methyl ester carboxylesterase
MAKFGAVDWRPEYRQLFPDAAAWVTERPVSMFLPIEKIAASTLLLWGDADAISPVAVGRHLAERMPNARLHVVPGGDHDIAKTHAAELTPLIERHLA